MPELELLTKLLLIALATLGSEDLACITAGVLASQGELPMLGAILACILGITTGDMLLFLAGRWLGPPAVRRAPLRWFVSESRVESSRKWFQKRGAIIILLTRFIPGSRTVTYFAAGTLKMNFLKFSLLFILAACLWVPLLVGLSYYLGGAMKAYFVEYQGWAPALILTVILIFILIEKCLLPTLTHKGRRLLLSAWRRRIRWEFWPRWIFYPPMYAWILWLGLRYRKLTLATAANPCMPAGGLVNESKAEILSGLSTHNDCVSPFRIVPRQLNIRARQHEVEAFMKEQSLDYPIALKPDHGERGDGVIIAHTAEQVRDYLAIANDDTIAQAYIGGCEYGVFYVKLPHQEKGHIFSVTRKKYLEVSGDGERTLETLILDDDRAVCMAPTFLKQHESRLAEVPGPGELVKLVELGTHCRGSLFLDGSDLITSELEACIHEISSRYDGFYFGRYDLKAPDDDALKAGRDIRIIELNGLTSEATHIYDPANKLSYAYRIIFKQWSMAFEIGKHNAAQGVKVASVSEVWRLWRNGGGGCGFN